MESPCHHCPKCPCKEHDTCPDFIKFRRGKLEEKRQKDEERAAIEATVLAVRRCKRKR